MAVVKIIPATKSNLIKREDAPNRSLVRVAAYCRVSTDTEEQESSYENQVGHYTNLIESNPLWSNAGIYADEGISGTNTKKRDSFNRLIKDCRDGKIDRIVTKSISRFARNTLDCLKYIRELKEINIGVYFEKENINTLDSKGEVLLTIMASLAQQESQSLSENVKLGIQHRYQQGKIQINHNRFLGYTKDDDGNLVIVPEEAEIIRRIFREFLEGSSMTAIAKGLERDGIKTGANRSKWHTSTINKILKNEKYVGDALLQKSYTVDFLTKKRVKNTGIMPQYYVKDNHEPIISRSIFEAVQVESSSRGTYIKEKRTHKNFSLKYALSNRVFCGKCGEVYRRITYTLQGKKEHVWRCLNRIEDGPHKCMAPTILESNLKGAVIQGINKVIASKTDVIENITDILQELVLDGSKAMGNRLDDELEKLQCDLLNAATDKKNYEQILDEIKKIRKEKELIQEAIENEIVSEQRLQDIKEFLENETNEIKEYNDSLVKLLVEKITIHHGSCEIEFRTGESTIILLD